MSILSVKTDSIGMTDVVPRVIYITTNDNQETVMSVGYLDKLSAQGISFSSFDMALVATKESISDKQYQLSFYNISKDQNGEITLSLAEASNIFESIVLVNSEGNSVTLQVPSSGLTNTTYTFPTSNSPGVLTTDINGNLSWESVGGVGTVTSISAGTGITCNPDPITSSGVVSLSSTPVTAASYTYGNGGFTVDGFGRLTAASSATNIVTSVTTNQVGSNFSASVASNLLTISLPDASLVNRGVWTTGTQSLKGNKQLLGSWEIINSTDTSPVLKCINNYISGDTQIATYYAPYLSDTASISYSLGFQAAENDEVITSFTKTETGSPNNYYKVELNGSGFGFHLTKNTTRIGSTGTGPLAGVGRTGSDGFDGVFPAWEFNSDSTSYYGFCNLSTSIDADGNPLGILAFSTYADAVTDGFHIGGAVWGTGDFVTDGHLYGSLVFNVNTGGSLTEVLRLRNDRAIMTPQMATVDPMSTLAGYDQSCIAMQYNWEPNATLGGNVTGVDKVSTWWQRVGNVVTCYVKWKVTVGVVSAGDAIEWYCDLPSNITGVSLANPDDLVGHLTFFKTPNFNSGTVIGQDNQHAQFTAMCLQIESGNTYPVTSSWSYVINP